MALITTGDTEESKQLAQRQIEGLYTLEEAVNALCQNVESLNKEVLLADLVQYVEYGKVQVNLPGRDEEGKIPRKIRTFYEVAEWSKLNDNWLSTYKHIVWRFPDPLERLRPDWSYWNCDHLSLENAICLSINIIPEWKNFSVIGRKNTLRISFDYSPRLTNALNWAQDPNCLWRFDNPIEFKETNQVKLSEFARWVILEKADWAIPSEFMALAKVYEITHLPIKTKSETQTWQLKPGKTYPGYRRVLFEFLEEEHNNGKEHPPTAYEFIANLKKAHKEGHLPEKIYISNKWIEYETSDGKTNKADLKAISQAINGLILKLPNAE